MSTSDLDNATAGRAHLDARQPYTYRDHTVPCHRVIELATNVPRRLGNPLVDANLAATFTTPSGREITWHGFWDGGDTWRVRFSPDEEGRWHYRLRVNDANDSSLSATEGTFVATPSLNATLFDRHGLLQVAADHRHLEHRDGTPFFWLADTAWNGPLLSTDDEWNLYLATRTRQGFRAVQWVATHWRASPNGDRDGQLAFTSSAPLHVNPKFFQRLDGKVERTAAAGLVNVPVMLWAIGSGANPTIDPGFGLPEDEAVQLARYEVARWGAYPVVWILAGDGKYFGDYAARWRRIGRATFGDLTHAPVAMHCGGEQWPADELRGEPWLDILGYQSGHGDSEKTLNWMVNGPPATEWDKTPRLLQINFEPAYENHIAYHSRQPHPPHNVRTAMYWSLLNAPTAGVSYGGHGVWGWDDGTTAPTDHPSTGVPLPWQQALTMPAAEQVAHLAVAFTAIAWWTLRPAQSLLLAQPGMQDIHRHIMVAADDARTLVVAYTPFGGDIRIDASQLAPGLAATWYNPRTGAQQPASAARHAGDNSYTFTTPDAEDWLLILQT